MWSAHLPGNVIHRRASHVQTFSRHQDRSTCRFFFPSVGGPSIKSTWILFLVCFKAVCARVIPYMLNPFSGGPTSRTRSLT